MIPLTPLETMELGGIFVTVGSAVALYIYWLMSDPTAAAEEV